MPDSKEIKKVTKTSSNQKVSSGNARNGAMQTSAAGNQSIFQGGKIRIDLTQTKYKVVKECAQEMGWKVVAAKKDKDKDGTTGTKDDKKEGKMSHKQATAEAAA